MNAQELLNEYTIEPGHNGVLEIRDVDRVHDLATYLAKFSRVGVEVGVAHGKYSECLMEANPKLTLYGVDSYAVYQGYKDYQLERTMAALRADAHTRLDRFPTYHFVQKFSMDALNDFADESLDFVYIDANHTEEEAYKDIVGWEKKVIPGGVVCGHDYARIRGREHDKSDQWGVIQALDKFRNERPEVKLYIWGLNSKADPSLKRDNSRSWSFIKE